MVTTHFRRTLPVDSKPILIVEKPDLVRKPKPVKESLHDGETNGTAVPISKASFKRKRSVGEADFDESQDLVKKRGKVHQPPDKNNDLVVVEDTGNGAIFIDDD